MRLLVKRDLTVRYKRSALGIWWTLLNPLLFTAVLWLVFSQVFRFAADDNVPYVVYLLSGVLVTTFFSQGAQGTGLAIVSGAGILKKVYVPPECFAVAAAVGALINFLITLVPILVIQLILGVGIPWTVVLVPLPVFMLFVFLTGVGLMIAALAVYFYDVLDLSSVFIQLLVYLTPAFYPVTIVPDHLRAFIQVNPLYSHLTVLRHFLYRGDFPPGQYMAYMVASSLVSIAVGVALFTKTWRRLVVTL